MCTQILPQTLDEKKWVSFALDQLHLETKRDLKIGFKEKASVFFNGLYDEELNLARLESPENALMMAPDLIRHFDHGEIVLRFSLGEVSNLRW